MAIHFDSRAAGTPEALWQSSWLPELPPIQSPTAGRLLVVVAHPDDETLGAGGLIASMAQRRRPTTIVIASDGEASHPLSPTYSAATLAQLRRAEVSAAISELHPEATVHFLGLPDSSLSAHIDELAHAIEQHAAAVTLLATTWTGDGHPDHAACADAGALVAERAGIEHWQFPIWAWQWATPQSSDLPRTRLRRFSLNDAARTAKANALAAHVSQHTALSAQPGDEAILSESMLAHSRRDYEVFVLTRPAPATSSVYFDDLYSEQADPWGLADRFYEQRKRDLLLASLPRRRFRQAFEPGCATGLLTVELARRCDAVFAWDGAQVAVDQARARVNGLGFEDAVTVDCGRIPTAWPSGTFDLIVLSEVGYYCPNLQQLHARIVDGLSEDGVLVACHWRQAAPDHAFTAEEVHRSVGEGLHRIVTHHEDDFLLDVWTRDGRSVAALEGIVQ